MKRLTLKQAEERITQLDKDGTMTMLAMNALCRDEVEWLPKFKGEGGHYCIGYFGLDRADGGLVLFQWTQSGIKPYTTVQYLDEAYNSYRQHYSYPFEDQLRAACAFIMTKRNKVYADKQDKASAA